MNSQLADATDNSDTAEYDIYIAQNFNILLLFVLIIFK